MSSIGWATMAVIPSAVGFSAAITKQIVPEMALAGKASGDSFSKGMLKASAGIAAIGLGVGIVAVKMAANFQETTTLLVTGAGESEKSIGLIRDGLLAMAPAVGIGPTALAKAMFLVESAGYHGAAGLIVMKAAAEGAKIGGADATVVANGLTTALTDYHLPASMAATVTSKLVATVAAGKTNMEQLSGSLSTILPFASSFGVSLNDVAGAMATMTGEGISADTSATMLKFTMMSMANETPKGRDALKSIGMTAQQLKNDLSSQGVGGALQTVTDQIGKKFPAGSVAATAALAAIVGGTRGMGSALALTGTHAATLTANITSIGTASTEVGGHVKGWKLAQEDLNVKLSEASGLAQSMAVRIGTALIPAMMGALEDGQRWTTWLTNHATATWAIVGALGAFATAAIAVKIASLASATATGVWTAATGLGSAAMWLFNAAIGTSMGATLALKAMYLASAIATGVMTAAQWLLNAALTANPIGLVIAGIGLLVGAIVLIATKTTWFQTIWEYMSHGLAVAWQWLWNVVVAPIIRFILDGFGSIVGGISNMLLALGHIPHFGWATDAGNAMKGAAAQAHAMANGIKDIPDQKLVNITFTSNYSQVQQQLLNLSNSASKLGAMGIGHNAAGTDNWRGGLTVVGELGPEIVNLPKGSQVIPNNKIGGSAGSDALLTEVQGLRAETQGLRSDVRGLLRGYQTMQRQMA